MEKATLRDVNNLVGRRVFIRVDYNVPVNDSGQIVDDNKIRQSLITIKYCLGRGAKVILASHFGRPEGVDHKYSLEPVCLRLRKLLPRTTVYFADDCVGEAVKTQVAALRNGEILLLENTRFHREEEQNDDKFSKELAELADIYVNDAFGTAHRAHSSTAGITKYLPAVAGFLIEKELTMLSAVAYNPARPLTIICGGKKIADKLGVVENLFKVADNVLIGGGMAFTFIKAMGGKVGGSIVDDTKIEYCRECIKNVREGVNLVIAGDAVIAKEVKRGAVTQTVNAGEIPDGYMGLDIGDKTVKQFTDIINRSATVFWNGPLGVSEIKEFANGTRSIAMAVASGNAISVVGGGDTASEITRFVKPEDLTHISTGGGASLEFIEGRTLPGINSLLSAEEFNIIEAKGGTNTK
jgi:3-phosphoglycerate kinase